MLRSIWFWVIAIVIFVILLIGLCVGAVYALPRIQSGLSVVGPQGPAGESIVGPAGPQGPAGKDADPAVLLQDPKFLVAVKQALDAPVLANPYMTAYQAILEYTVPDALRVPASLLAGFEPVPSLVKTDFFFPNGYKVLVPPPPADVTDWYCFPQDYSKGDQFNAGCKTLQAQGKLPWKTPEAGYNDGDNRFSDTPNGWTAEDIQALNWKVYTGYELCHPAVGCIKDPDGGAVMILVVNFLDSDEVWNVRNGSAVFADSGFTGYGVMWDLSGGKYDVGKGIADIRNHYLYDFSSPVSPADNHLRGQCGSSALCKTVTYVTIARVWDRSEIGIKFSHFELIDFGQWKAPAK